MDGMEFIEINAACSRMKSRKKQREIRVLSFLLWCFVSFGGLFLLGLLVGMM